MTSGLLKLNKMDQLIFKFPFSKKYYEQDFFVSNNNLATILPNFNLNDYKIGVFGKIKSPDYIIKETDRLELYEPISIDPKVRRKKIAGKK